MSQTGASPNPRPQDNRDMNASGRGRGRGRGRGLGRGGPGRGIGRGRGAAPDGRPVDERVSFANPRNERAPKPRLTHFLAIPLGHNPAFRQTVSAFTDALRGASPAIPGLDTTIVIPARRLHFTLGVMSLDVDASHNMDAQPAHTQSRRTLAAAAKLLLDIKPSIMELLGHEKLRVSLDSMDIMRPERGDSERAHVMWVGPAGAHSDTFRAVAHLVQKAFKQAGLLVDEDRALKVSGLHCTVLNTIYRNPKTQRRMPFSYPSILASEAVDKILVQSDIQAAGNEQGNTNTQKGPVHVDFGEWAVNEIQICKMGSWGCEGEYVCVARCELK